MSSAPIELLAECEAHGIQLTLAGDGGLTIDAPQDALTPVLLDRLNAHKADLIAVLGRMIPSPANDPTDATAVWRAALSALAGDLRFPLDVLEALRAAEVQWADEGPNCDFDVEQVFEPLGPDGWPVNAIDPEELTPCPKCGTLELWQSAASDLFGFTPGRWRCVKCEPPRK